MIRETAHPLPLIARALAHHDRPAIEDGHRHTYADLLNASARVAAALLDGRPDLKESRVAFLVPAGFVYAAVQWGIWRAGGIAVPLALSHPPAEWATALVDSDAESVVAAPELVEGIGSATRTTGARLLRTDDLLGWDGSAELPLVERSRRAMIVYTSGTTGAPKGVVTTHATIEAQVTSLVEAWEWSADDRILLVLPLHHVHGIINVLTCALWSGALCETHSGFDAARAWDRLASGHLTLFMAVPTIYRRLIAYWEAATETQRARLSAGSGRLRLMVSGSAALPSETMEAWRVITGHTLLERYGMTEIGMALSNPLRGPRRPGMVGSQLPGVEVRLVEDGRPAAPGEPGEIEVRGPTVFLEYWRRPEETRDAFRDGWFRTGDVAVAADGAYRILGRTNVDIIKTGGYKVSALEIEEALRRHVAIADCCVVGLEDAEWGQRVGALVELQEGARIDLDALRAWARDRLAPYKLPTVLKVVSALPRNAMGKVRKPEAAELLRQTRGDP